MAGISFHSLDGARTMPTTHTVAQLVARKCLPCEGGVEPCSLNQAEQQLRDLPGWRLTHEGKRIRKDWTVRNFLAGMDFFGRVAELAEAEGHHPDLHLEGYRQVWIEIWTHAIGGLSENDFILAAKIDQLPVGLKPSKQS
jgi:4a-hydroxytetrahydrobiopterin dehydratase